MVKKSQIAKETIIYFIGTFFVAILGFVISLLYSHLFTPTDYGVYSIAFSTYSLVSQIYGGWMIQSLIRNVNSAKNNNYVQKLYSSFFQSHLFMSILFIVVFNSIICLLNLSIETKLIYFLLTIVYFFEQQLLITNTIFRANSNSKRYVINNVCNQLIKIISLLFIYYVINYQSIILITISILLSEIVQFIYLFTKFNIKRFYSFKNYSLDLMKKMFIFGFPLVGVAITSWILNVSDRYIINSFYTFKEVGIYSFAYTISNSLFSLLIQFIMLGAYPNIISCYEKYGKNKTESLIKKYLKIYFWVLIPILIGSILVSNNFFSIMTGNEYRGGGYIFSITCISIFILGISQYANKAWELVKKPQVILYFNIIAAVVNIILNIIFIPKCGYEVAALTTLIAYIVYLLLDIICSNRYLKFSIDYKSLGKVVLSTLFMSCFIILFNMFINIDNIFLLLFEIIIGGLIYILSLLFLKEFNLNYLKKVIK